MRDVKVAAIQMESLAGDKEANFRKVARFAEQAAAQGVELLVWPECSPAQGTTFPPKIDKK